MTHHGSAEHWAQIAEHIRGMCAIEPAFTRARQLWQSRKGSAVVQELLDLGLDETHEGQVLIQHITAFNQLSVQRVSAGTVQTSPTRRNPSLSAHDVQWIEDHEHIVEAFVAERGLRRYRPGPHTREVTAAFERMARRMDLSPDALFDLYLRSPRDSGQSSIWKSNPKRDGSPTRGEMRKSKRLDWLRGIRERGHAAERELKRLTGRGRITGEPVLKADKTPTQQEHPGHFAQELSQEAKFAEARIAEIDRTMAELREQMQDLGDEDEDVAEALSNQLVKLGEQKRALKPATVATNPRGYRCFPGGRQHMAAYSSALRDLAHAIHQLGYVLDGTQRRHRRRRR